MTVEQITRMAAKATEEMAISDSLSKTVQIAKANRGLSASLAAHFASDTLAGALPEQRIAALGKGIKAAFPEDAFVGFKLNPDLKETMFKGLLGTSVVQAWKGAGPDTLAASIVGTKLAGALSEQRISDLGSSITRALLDDGLFVDLKYKAWNRAGSENLAAHFASDTLAGALSEQRIAALGKSIKAAFPEDKSKALLASADQALKGALGAAAAESTPKLSEFLGVASIEGPGVELPVPARRRRRAIEAPVIPLRSSDVRPKILPQEVGELFATGLVRTDREEVIYLLTDTGLDDARQHLEEIEERLLRGTRPSFLHAALSASILMRDLANYLYPPRDEDWESRFETKHSVRAKNVGNRLSAFVDLRLRSQLSPKEHQLFQATLDVVYRWTGEGHHVVSSAREAAAAFRQLLEVLAVVARAYKSQ